MGRKLEGRHRIQKAGRQTPQTSIAKPGINFHFLDLIQLITNQPQRLPAFFIDPEVDQIVAQTASDEVFQREVIDLADRVQVIGLLGVVPKFNQAVTKGSGQTPVNIKVLCGITVFALGKFQMMGHRVNQPLAVHTPVISNQIPDFFHFRTVLRHLKNN